MSATRRWGVPAVVGALTAALVLAACSDPEVDASKNRKAIVAGDRYVSLGDSYTSGPGLGQSTYEKACQQTDGNYPHLLAEALDLDLVDVSCGGATTENMTRPQRPAGGKRVPPQLDAVTEDTDLVTLSIGGNNGGVYGNLVVTCAQLALDDPTGSPCADVAEENPDALKKIFAQVSDAIVRTVGAVLETAPEARVVVIGYPQIFPADGACDLLPLAEGDYPFAREVLAQFARAQEKGALEAEAEFVDMWSATQGHDICSDDPWVAGVIPQRRSTPYHPYSEAQDTVAAMLEELVTVEG